MQLISILALSANTGRNEKTYAVDNCNKQTNMRIYFNFCFKSVYYHMVQNLKDTKGNKEEILYLCFSATDFPSREQKCYIIK